MEEQWYQCNPVAFPEGRYELIELTQTFDGLKLVFDDGKSSITVEYKDELLAFRSCDESDRWRTISDVLATHEKGFLPYKLMFKVENSDFKKWFVRECFGIREMDEFEHHCFVTPNDIVDVLAVHEPEIQIGETKA